MQIEALLAKVRATAMTMQQSSDLALGVAIEQHFTDKIFQPFSTTKPTVQGTGLGLSLSYDSIKAHGGEL